MEYDGFELLLVGQPFDVLEGVFEDPRTLVLWFVFGFGMNEDDDLDPGFFFDLGIFSLTLGDIFCRLGFFSCQLRSRLSNLFF